MMIGAQQALAAAHRTDINGWFFSDDGQMQGLQAVVNGIDVADTQNSPFYGQPSLEAAVAIAQGVTFHGTTLELANKTFTCQTTTLCSQTRSYLAQMQLAHQLF
jgi:ABC-type sugar transport system substrate-binding protein